MKKIQMITFYVDVHVILTQIIVPEFYRNSVNLQDKIYLMWVMKYSRAVGEIYTYTHISPAQIVVLMPANVFAKTVRSIGLNK